MTRLLTGRFAACRIQVERPFHYVRCRSERDTDKRDPGDRPRGRTPRARRRIDATALGRRARRAIRPAEEHDFPARLRARAAGPRPAARGARAPSARAGAAPLREPRLGGDARRARPAEPAAARGGLRRDDQPRRPRPRGGRASRPARHRPLRRDHRLGRAPGRLRRAAGGKVFLAFNTRAPKLADVRAGGYATSVDELKVGLTAIAAPVVGRRDGERPAGTKTGCVGQGLTGLTMVRRNACQLSCSAEPCSERLPTDPGRAAKISDAAGRAPCGQRIAKVGHWPSGFRCRRLRSGSVTGSVHHRRWLRSAAIAPAFRPRRVSEAVRLPSSNPEFVI